jgi:hypothetical protein
MLHADYGTDFLSAVSLAVSYSGLLLASGDLV